MSTLPSELIVSIMAHTTWKDILHCMQVCKRFESIVKESTELQYYVEIAIAGLRDDGHVDIPFAVRLQKLRAQENAWWNLSWSQHKILPQKGTTAAYDLHGGVWARGTGETYAGLSREINLSVLPSPWMSNSVPKTWSFKGLAACRDFAIDPSQDLFVWIESDFIATTPKIHVCSLSTGKPHPLAHSPVIEQLLVRNSGYIISICGPNLGILFETVELRIWNWMEGNVLCVQECSEEFMTDFAFLNQDSFILAYPGETPPVIRLYSINSASSAPSVTFELPEVKSGIDVHLRFRVDPPPPPSQFAKDCSFTPQAKPFFIREEDRILALSLWLVLDDNSDYKFGVVMTMQTFLNRASHQNMVVPWNSWSAETVWLETHEFVRDWIFYIYGTRYAIILAYAGEAEETEGVETSDANTQYYLEVYDFNPILVRLSTDGLYSRYRPPLTVESHTCGLDTTSESKIDNDFFSFTFGERLPYRISRIPMDRPQPVEVAIDDERLIFLELSGQVGTTEIVSLSIYTP